MNTIYSKIDDFIKLITVDLQINEIKEVDYIIELNIKYHTFLNFIYSYNDEEFLKYFIYFLSEYVKILSNNILFSYEMYNNKNLFYFITILSNFDNDIIKQEKKIILNNLKNQLKEPLLNEMLKYFYSKLENQNDESQYFLLNTYLKSKYDIDLFFNMNKEYNLNDFLLSLTLFYTNINCLFIKNTIFNDDLINQDINNTPADNIFSDCNLNLLENKTFDKIIQDLRNNSKNDINKIFRFQLSLITILKCKNLCYHYKLNRYDCRCEILLMNFLYNFEKNIRKTVKTENINISKLPFNDLITKTEFIIKIKNNDFCYNIEYFIKIYNALLNKEYDFLDNYYGKLKLNQNYNNDDNVNIILKFYKVLVTELLINKPLKQHKEQQLDYFFNILDFKGDQHFNNRYITFKKRKFFNELFEIYQSRKFDIIDNFMKKFNSKFIKKSLQENITMTDKDIFIDSYAYKNNYKNINCLNFYEKSLNIYRPSYKNKQKFKQVLTEELLLFFKIHLDNEKAENIILNIYCNYNDDIYNSNLNNKQSIITLNINNDNGFVEFFISNSNNYFNIFTNTIFNFILEFFKNQLNLVNDKKRKFGIFTFNDKCENYNNNDDFIIDMVCDENEIFGEEDYMLTFDNFFTRIKTELYNFLRIKYYNKPNITPLKIINKITEFLLFFNQPYYFYYIFGKYIYHILSL
jgi:hypothetical protein